MRNQYHPTNPNDPLTYIACGESSLRSGDFKSALNYCDTALHISPEHLQAKTLKRQSYNAWHEKALEYLLRGNHTQSKREYEGMIAYNNTDAFAYHQLGFINHSKGYNDRALTYYQRAITLNPHSTLSYLNMGDILQERGEFQNAIQAYATVLAYDPANIDAQNSIVNSIAQTRQLHAPAHTNLPPAPPSSQVLHLHITQSPMQPEGQSRHHQERTG